MTSNTLIRAHFAEVIAMKERPGQFRELVAWQKAYALTLAIYRATKRFPSDERFGLTQQIRRAAISVPSNIAEGWGRGTRTDYLRFLNMARGSLYELETQLEIFRDLEWLPASEDLFELMLETGRILNGLIRSLQSG